MGFKKRDINDFVNVGYKFKGFYRAKQFGIGTFQFNHFFFVQVCDPVSFVRQLIIARLPDNQICFDAPCSRIPDNRFRTHLLDKVRNSLRHCRICNHSDLWIFGHDTPVDFQQNLFTGFDDGFNSTHQINGLSNSLWHLIFFYFNN